MDKKKVLVVIDMQNDFVTGSLRNEEAIKIVPYVVDKVMKATEDENTVVIYTRDTHGKDYMNTVEGKNLPVPHCIFKTPGWEIIDELRPFINEDTEIFDKATFGSVNLLDYMDAHKTEIESVEFIGVCTDICVISNVMLTKAAIPNVGIFVDAAGCAGVTPDNHDTALKSMKSCHIVVKNEGKETWRK